MITPDEAKQKYKEINANLLHAIEIEIDQCLINKHCDGSIVISDTDCPSIKNISRPIIEEIISLYKDWNVKWSYGDYRSDHKGWFIFSPKV